ncbi:MAG: hypothetical protein GEU73_06135 [Chloroflexi bacterium]|nr:hypothetical protein [Chloroflexota bacterium]
MAVTYTANTSTTTLTSRTNTLISKPSSVATGDTLLAVLHIRSATATVPAGWVLIGSVRNTSNDFWTYAAYRVVEAGDPSSWAWTHGSATTQGACERLTGVHATSVLDPGTVQVAQGSGTTHSVAGLTTLGAGTGVTLCISHFSAASYSSTTLTERFDNTRIGIFGAVQASAGATGTESASTSTSNGYAAVLFGFRDAAASIAGVVFEGSPTTVPGDFHTDTAIDKPFGTQTGDLLIAAMEIETFIADIDPPAGWTIVTKWAHPTVFFAMVIARRVVAAGDPASWNWSHPNAFSLGGCIRVSGAHTAGALDPALVSTQTGSSATHSAGGVTTTKAGAGIVLALVHFGSVTYSAPTLIERLGAEYLSLFGEVQASAGASGTESATASGSDDYVGAVFGIAPPVTVQTGAVSLLGSGTLTASGVRRQLGAVALAGSGSLAVAGTRTAGGSAALLGAGVLAVDGIRVASSAVPLAGSTSLAVAGVRQVTSACAFAATSILTADGHVTQHGAVALAATSALGSDGQVGASGTAVLTVSAALAAEGTVTQLGAVDVSVAGMIAADGVLLTSGAAHLTGAADLAAAGVRVHVGAAGLAGHATLLAAGVIGSVGETMLLMSAALTADGTVTQVGAVALDATATLQAAGFILVVGVVVGAAELAPHAELSVAGVRTTTGAAQLVADGSLAASGVRIVSGAVAFGSAAELTASGVRAVRAALELTVASALDVMGTQTAYGAVELLGSAELAISGEIVGVGPPQIPYPTPTRVVLPSSGRRGVTARDGRQTAGVGTGSRNATIGDTCQRIHVGNGRRSVVLREDR